MELKANPDASTEGVIVEAARKLVVGQLPLLLSKKAPENWRLHSLWFSLL